MVITACEPKILVASEAKRVKIAIPSEEFEIFIVGIFCAAFWMAKTVFSLNPVVPMSNAAFKFVAISTARRAPASDEKSITTSAFCGVCGIGSNAQTMVMRATLLAAS